MNAQLALGKFSMVADRRVATVEEALRRWYEDYKPTFSASFAEVAHLNIHRHLIPFFGHLRLTKVEERHLLHFIRAKTAPAGSNRPLHASTILNILSILRRVLTMAVEEGEIQRNPCRRLGKLMRQVERQQTEEVARVDSWSRDEVETLLGVARREERAFAPLLTFLLSTGCRKGEALALKWRDVDFEGGRLQIRRSLIRGQLGPPKSSKARSVVLSPMAGLGPPRSPVRTPSRVPAARPGGGPTLATWLRSAKTKGFQAITTAHQCTPPSLRRPPALRSPFAVRWAKQKSQR